MRRGPARALLRLVMYVLLACLLMLVGSAAYASQSGTALASAALSRPQGQVARPAATPVPPVTTVVAPSAFDQLRSDLEAIASGTRVGISLQELSGPRRNNLSLNGNATFTAASAYKVPLLMAEAQQVESGQASRSDVLCFDPGDAEDGWFDDYEDRVLFDEAGLYDYARVAAPGQAPRRATTAGQAPSLGALQAALVGAE